MKKSQYAIILLAIFLLNSCYDLDRYPQDRLSSETFYKTDEQAKESIMGVYSALKFGYAFGIYWANDVASDIAFGYDDNVGMQSIIQNSFTSHTGHVIARWTHTYDCIRRANTVIGKISASTSISSDVRKQVVAEAKFLRALLYFHLTNYFGGVPIYDEKVDYDKDYMNLQSARSSLDDVRKFIISDLTDAIADLPVKWDTDDYGRATKGAAYALRGKVYLYEKDYKKAAVDFEEIVKDLHNMGYGYSLYPNYADLFKPKGHDSDEMIFSIHNYVDTGFNLGMPFGKYVGNPTTFGAGWNNVLPSVALADSYELKNGKKFNWDDFFPGYNEGVVSNDTVRTHQIGREFYTAKLTTDKTAIAKYPIFYEKLKEMYDQRDPRMAETLILPYSIYKGGFPTVRDYTLVYAEGANRNNGFCTVNRYAYPYFLYLFRKFVSEGDMDGMLQVGRDDRDNTPINFPVIRYADVLLMLAECDNELGKFDEAVSYINMVRVRSCMPIINNGDSWMEARDKSAVFERIKHERAVELALEGHRYLDLRRWGLLKSTLTGPVKDIIGNVIYDRQPFTDNLLLWPIPQNAINANPNLIQNPGW